MPPRPLEVQMAYCSSEKARIMLGYKTQKRLEDALYETFVYIRSCGTKPFSYDNIEIEINNEKTPEPWKRQLI